MNKLENEKICQQDFIHVRRKFTPKLIDILKSYLTEVLIKLHDIGFSKSEFFTQTNEFGSLGIPTEENENDMFEYLLSNCTIREKMAAIDVILNKPKRPVLNNYLFTLETPWAKKRIAEIMRLTFVFDEDKLREFMSESGDNIHYQLWAPAPLIYSSYAYKRRTGQVKQTGEKCHYDKSKLLEPFSEKEIEFSGRDPEFTTGECWYRSVIDIISLDKSQCSVAGLSGTTIWGIELVKLLKMNWQVMLLCEIYFLVPFHHSLQEILAVPYVLKLTDSPCLFDDIYNQVMDKFRSTSNFEIEIDARTMNPLTLSRRVKSNRKSVKLTIPQDIKILGRGKQKRRVSRKMETSI